MELLLLRDNNGDNCCIGSLYVDDEYECDILEDPVREQKVDGEWIWRPEFKIPERTAIPSGAYSIGLHDSPKFGRTLPILQSVPDFTYVLIHPGNWAHNTEGCLLPGNRDDPADAVWQSRKAFEALFKKVSGAIVSDEPVTITIINDF